MAFTNIWQDNIPLATAQASLGYLNMQQIRVDVEQRLAQGLCGLSANLPAALEAQFTTGAGAGMPFYAYDQHKIWQLTAASTYSEVATLDHWLIDVTATSFTNPAGTVTLNSVTIPGGFLATPPYLIEIEEYFNLTVVGSFPSATFLFGAATVLTNNFIGGAGPGIFKARIYVSAPNVQTIWGITEIPSGVAAAAPVGATVNTTNPITVSTTFTGTTSTIKGGWLTVKILK